MLRLARRHCQDGEYTRTRRLTMMSIFCRFFDGLTAPHGRIASSRLSGSFLPSWLTGERTLNSSCAKSERIVRLLALFWRFSEKTWYCSRDRGLHTLSTTQGQASLMWPNPDRSAAEPPGRYCRFHDLTDADHALSLRSSSIPTRLHSALAAHASPELLARFPREVGTVGHLEAVEQFQVTLYPQRLG